MCDYIFMCFAEFYYFYMWQNADFSLCLLILCCLWCYDRIFCLCRILPLYMVACIGEQKNTPYWYILSKLYIISIQFKSINYLFKLSIQLKICILQLLLFRPVILSRYPIKFQFHHKNFCLVYRPVFYPCKKSQVITKLDFFYTSHKSAKVSFTQQQQGISRIAQFTNLIHFMILFYNVYQYYGGQFTFIKLT